MAFAFFRQIGFGPDTIILSSAHGILLFFLYAYCLVKLVGIAFQSSTLPSPEEKGVGEESIVASFLGVLGKGFICGLSIIFLGSIHFTRGFFKPGFYLDSMFYSTVLLYGTIFFLFFRFVGKYLVSVVVFLHKIPSRFQGAILFATNFIGGSSLAYFFFFFYELFLFSLGGNYFDFNEFAMVMGLFFPFFLGVVGTPFFGILFFFYQIESLRSFILWSTFEGYCQGTFPDQTNRIFFHLLIKTLVAWMLIIASWIGLFGILSHPISALTRFSWHLAALVLSCFPALITTCLEIVWCIKKNAIKAPNPGFSPRQ